LLSGYKYLFSLEVLGITLTSTAWQAGKQTMDRKSLDPNTEVMRFWPLFHDSNIPSFLVAT
jgi:hypothetical protein